MPISGLEQTLKDLPRHGALVKDRGYRQVWRFEYDGAAYYLKFYPRRGGRLKRLVRGTPAVREYVRLQWLQKAGVPAPHPRAVLMGFSINGTLGDAVVLDAIEPAVQLDRYLSQCALAGQGISDRKELTRHVIDLVYQLGKAKLGHRDLHPGNMLLHDGKLYLLDGYAVEKGGLRRRHVLQLGHSLSSYATKTELLRGWELLGDGGPLPSPDNVIGRRQWRKFLERVNGDNPYFGRLTSPTGSCNGWNGVFFKHFKYPNRWSNASHMTVSAEDWLEQWPDLLTLIEEQELQMIKHSPSGDVLAAQIVLAGRPLDVVVKRPFRRYWYRYINEIGRGSRARRAWYKAWTMIARGIPTAWPLLLMEKRRLGYVTDSLIVMERVPGHTLTTVDLNALAPEARERLMRRTGRLLRRIERLGFAHFDAKSSNWIVYDDPAQGVTPVLIDVDGIRHRRWETLGIRRLLRSMREHAQYTPADSLALCRGYAPYARLEMIKPDGQRDAAT